MKNHKAAASLLLIVALLCGCAHFPENGAQPKYDSQAGYRFGNCAATSEDDATFIVLAFSGGGTRAAAFSLGVLEELRKTPLPKRGTTQPAATLLDQVDVISSVSGGSFTAAYYGLYRSKIFDESEFGDRFLYHDVQGDLTWSLLNPVNWWKLGSSNYSRIDLAAEYYDRKIFHSDTFAALEQQKQRPFIVLNATDMSLGARFEFTQGQFDLLMSNLASVPVARGVAASSAFPILLTPLVVRNYPKEGVKEPRAVPTAINNDLEESPRRWRWAMNVRSYFDPNRRFIHLMDGGLADNLGIRGLLESLEFPDVPNLDDGRPSPGNRNLSIQRMLAADKIRRLVFIIADAKPGDSRARDNSSHTPGIIDVAMTTGSTPMANYSFESAQALREYCDLIEKEHGDAEMKKVKTYVIHLRFDSVKDEGARQYLQGLGTNFHLPKDAVDKLRCASAQLLRESETFQQLLRDLGSSR